MERPNLPDGVKDGTLAETRRDLSRRQMLMGTGGFLAAAVLTPALASGQIDSGRTQTFTVGSFLVDIAEQFIRVRHRADASRSLWETNQSQPFLRVAQGNAVFREHGIPLGTFDVQDKITALLTFTKLDSVKAVHASHLSLTGRLSGPDGSLVFHLSFRALSTNQLQFQIRTEGACSGDWNRIYLRYGSSASEGFFGFGQQLTYFNQKGNVLPILVQEHGIGRGLPVITDQVNQYFDGAGGTPYLTEAPAPHYITSELRSLFLENKEYSEFDLSAEDSVGISLFANQMTGRIVFAQTPLDLIEEYSSYAGRMRPMPDWVHEGVMVASQESKPGHVATVLDHLLAANLPLSALWLQDWSGIKVTPAGQQVLWNWQLDRSHYPNWDALVDRLAENNARMCVYINPFLIPDLGTEEQPRPSELYQEADEKGFLVKQNGANFAYLSSSFSAGMIDLSNPQARTWMQELIQKELIGTARASGWMADFGEALPFDAELFARADPKIWHNHYPEAWSRVHREAIESTDSSGTDLIFWNRSGFTQSPGVSTCFWLGDQLQTWDEFDGIKTAVVGLLSGGVSGFSLLHSDTGGYVAAPMTDTTPLIARSKELLMRWMELNAFTAMFRTHEGLIPSISAQVDDDGETLAHLARFGSIYKSLAPYRKQLVAEAAAKGHPVVRHLFLHYPQDPNVIGLRYQFLLGPDLLIAPVLDEGATTVRVYLPAGEWTHLWSGSVITVSEGTWVIFAAPLGKPGVFIRGCSEAGAAFVDALKMARLL